MDSLTITAQSEEQMHNNQQKQNMELKVRHLLKLGAAIEGTVVAEGKSVTKVQPKAVVVLWTCNL